MRNLMVCDMCGKKSPESPQPGYHNAWTPEGWKLFGTDLYFIDLCGECSSQIESFISEFSTKEPQE